MKKIKVTLRKDGTQDVEVLGASGEECLRFTHDLERRLGRPVGARTLKPEYRDEEPGAGIEAEPERER
jgi:hypothetical protein